MMTMEANQLIIYLFIQQILIENLLVHVKYLKIHINFKS